MSSAILVLLNILHVIEDIGVSFCVINDLDIKNINVGV